MGLENNIPEGWVESKLSDIIELKIDNRGRNPEYYLEEGIPVIDNFMIKGKRGIDLDTTKRYIDHTLYKTFIRTHISPGDLLITLVGNGYGNVSLAPKIKSVIIQNTIGLRTNNKSLNEFLFYNLSYKKKRITNLDIGAAQPSIKVGNLLNIEINLPRLPEQKAIAKVLTAFDDKIELLQAQNKTLETMAQTIFKEWFGKHQKESSPPNGWRTFSLSELVDTINGYSYKGKELVEESNEALVTLKSFDRNGGFQTRGFKPFKGLPKTQHEVKIGDLVVAHTDLTQDAEVLGNPAFIFDNGGFEKMYITMDLVKVISKNDNIGSSFLYYLMKDRYFKGHCVGYSNGTTVLHLSKKAIPEYELYLPENFDLIKKFTKIANDTTNKISLNKDAIKALTKTRDTLLPKLMSGQVRVNNLKQTADA